MRLPALAAVLAAVALLLAACSENPPRNGDPTEPSAATATATATAAPPDPTATPTEPASPTPEPTAQPTAPPAASPPPGWETLDEPAYTANVNPEWEVIFLTEEQVDALLDPENLGALEGLDLDPGALADAMSLLRLEGVLVAALDGDGIPNISAMWCLPAVAVPRDIEGALAAYALTGAQAEDAGTISHREGESYLVRVELAEGFTTYQTAFASGGCYTQVALSVDEDDEELLDAFRAFVAGLEVRSVEEP